jgi:NAD-reducing hydrogenase small subunit
MARLKLATVWLAGCSGCHMSFLDLDEWLIDLAAQADVVFSPVADIKDFPEGVDVALVEGAVANEDNLHQIKLIRQRSRILVSFGDCAVTGNVTALRNSFGPAEIALRRSYVELPDTNARLPEERGILPVLLNEVLPVHQVVPVDYYLPGCPPPAARIRALLEALLAGREPSLTAEQIKFG